LFRSDGTAAGTVPVARLDREPSLLALRKGRVWVDLEDLRYGRELWSFDPGAVVEQVGHACGEGLALPWIDGGDPVLGRTWSVGGGGGEPGMPGLLVLGAIAPRPQHVAGWCWSVLDPTTAMVARGITDSGSPWTWSVPLPNSPAIAGLAVALQSWHASSAGLASSPGLRAVLR
jgi:hypothetical protein